jgi:hypothetical protein
MRPVRSISRSRIRLFVLAAILLLVCPRPAEAQFSPGELSKAHRALEGSQNCVKCHDVGQEISGVKCMACHAEIKAFVDAKRGFHGRAVSERCVTCHKEHLGVDAKTTNFEKQSFDHTTTGFVLDGKHSAAACEKCHTSRYIISPAVIASLNDHPRQTFLGLDTKCVSCHQDVHKGKFQQNCAQCHSTSGWRQVKGFDHTKARFPLEGKHAQVECAKCHASMGARQGKGPVDFSTKPFTDCTPCHASPHKMRFAGQTCSTCHSAQGWAEAMKRPFDHSRTSYPLKGRHAQLECAACHRMEERRPFAATFLRPFARCTDCHADKHNGEFAKKYKNDCAACHTVERYKPSTFTLARHAESRFGLSGAHTAIVCAGCHTRAGQTAPTFQFASLRCEVCHKDVHKGQFADKMQEKSCDACHTTQRWSNGAFDHATTAFPLIGRHAVTACASCHKELAAAGAPRYNKLATDCASCHKDAHQGQFAKDGSTACATCHTPAGWSALVFDHEKQSAFKLTGAHKNVACRACHRTETAGGVTLTRFKPLDGVCASCHAKGGPR